MSDERSKRAKRSRDKGAAFERYCKRRAEHYGLAAERRGEMQAKDGTAPDFLIRAFSALHHEAKASESESVDAMVRQAEAAGGKDSVVVYKRNRRQVRAVVPFELYLELLAIADGQSDFEATVEMAQDFGTKYHEAREALEKIERGNEYVDNAFRLSRHNQNQIVRSVLAIADAAA